MNKTVLQIVPALDHEEAARQVCLLARGLAVDQFQVHVCALARGGQLSSELLEAGIPVKMIGKIRRFDPRAYRQLCGYVGKLRPGLIHAWLPEPSVYGYAAARRFAVKRLVIGVRRSDPWRAWSLGPIERYAARRADRIVLSSSAVRDFYVRHGFPSERIRVIHNGVVGSEPAGTTRRQLLADLGLPQGSRLVGLVGPLELHRRIKDAIWAADLLKVIRDDVHLLIVGDGPHARRLHMFREHVCIRDKVHFLGARDDARRLMPHFDVFWSTTAVNEPSTAIMEAMAASVPVVATDLPANRELVLPDVTGSLVPVGDRAALARRTNKLLDDADLAARLGQAGRERMQREFPAEKMVEQYEHLYRDLLTYH